MGKKPAGYYVLMRESTSPYWEKKFYVTDTHADLAYSKDNYFFAVQSVDTEGHESLPVVPKPVRSDFGSFGFRKSGIFLVILTRWLAEKNLLQAIRCLVPHKHDSLGYFTTLLQHNKITQYKHHYCY